MFSTKNISPRQLSLFTAFVLAVPVSLLILFVEKSWLWAAGAFIIIFGGAYLLISFVLERFIYRKIKLIYKFIYQTKATKKEETYYKYLLPQKSIDEVREDVEAWAIENEKELELLRQNEQFRREFLQNLSHEFKTPVFAIQGYIDTLLSGALANPDVNKKFLEKTSNNVARLTRRQHEILELVVAGHPSKIIAADLCISQRTVDNHRAAIMKKTGATSIPLLVRTALAAGQ